MVVVTAASQSAHGSGRTTCSRSGRHSVAPDGPCDQRPYNSLGREPSHPGQRETRPAQLWRSLPHGQVRPRLPERACPAALTAAEIAKAGVKVKKSLAAAKAPLMRISLLLCGEAIDAFLGGRNEEGAAVSAPGLCDLDSRWAGFGASRPGVSAHKGIRSMGEDIADSNNVAFTETYRLGSGASRTSGSSRLEKRTPRRQHGRRRKSSPRSQT
jgi:hypothetical protein